MTFHPPGGRPPSLRRRASKFLYFLLRGNSWAHSSWLAAHDAPKGDYRGVPLAALESAFAADSTWADIGVGQGRLSSRALGLAFTGQAPDRSYAIWRELAARGWSFEQQPDRLKATNGQLKLDLYTEEEAEMAREIFYDECYDFHPSGAWEVVDIGANVGMAALHFASQPWVQRVYAFEPFQPTADSCEKNLQLNPVPAEKITLSRVGLGETTETLTVDYHPDQRGSMSIGGLGAWRGQAESGGVPTEIKVLPASQALSLIIAARGERRLLAKIDCEGSEYAILRDLAKSGLLTAFSALVIEWHGKGPEELAHILTSSGFTVQARPLSADKVSLGLLRAYRLAG